MMGYLTRTCRNSFGDVFQDHIFGNILFWTIPIDGNLVFSHGTSWKRPRVYETDNQETCIRQIKLYCQRFPRTRWLDEIKDITGMRINQLLKATEERKVEVALLESRRKSTST